MGFLVKDRKMFKTALKACIPVILGYLPTGFAFGLMLTTKGYSFAVAVIMSIVIYTGVGQFVAVQMLVGGFGYLQIALMTFLINSKHLFYGFSLLDDFKKAEKGKLYFMFSLTDETYALLTEPRKEDMSDAERKSYCFYVDLINQASWVIATFLGAVLGSFIKFDTSGMDFAMTALFIIIIMEQWKNYKTKIPFFAGAASALFSMFAFGKENMILIGIAVTSLLLFIFRKRVEQKDSTDISSEKAGDNDVA